MAYEVILFEVVDQVAKITLNRPERLNAWNPQMRDEMTHALRAANADDAIRAVVITGAGRGFCAGADLGPSAEKTFARAVLTDAELEERESQLTRPNQIDKPVIAAINGAAVGVGITFPLLCDIRLVAEDAKIGFSFGRRGMIGELGSHFLLPRIVGFSVASDLLLSGRMISGTEAADFGLAHKALPREQLLDAAMAMAKEYVNVAPVSVAISKRLLWDGMGTTLQALRNKESRLFAWAGSQPDSKEGIRSFLEKRKPAWKMSVARDLPEGLNEKV